MRILLSYLLTILSSFIFVLNHQKVKAIVSTMITVRLFIQQHSKYKSFKPTLSKLRSYFNDETLSLETELGVNELNALEEWINIENRNISIQDSKEKKVATQLMEDNFKPSPGPPFNPDELKVWIHIIKKK